MLLVLWYFYPSDYFSLVESSFFVCLVPCLHSCSLCPTPCFCPTTSLPLSLSLPLWCAGASAILVFLPGLAEITDTMKAMQGHMVLGTYTYLHHLPYLPYLRSLPFLPPPSLLRIYLSSLFWASSTHPLTHPAQALVSSLCSYFGG